MNNQIYNLLIVQWGYVAIPITDRDGKVTAIKFCIENPSHFWGLLDLEDRELRLQSFIPDDNLQRLKGYRGLTVLENYYGS